MNKIQITALLSLLVIVGFGFLLFNYPIIGYTLMAIGGVSFGTSLALTFKKY